MSYIIVNEKSNLAHEFSTFSCLAVPKPFQKLYNFHIIIRYYITGVPDFIEWALNKVDCISVCNRSEPCMEPWWKGGFGWCIPSWVNRAMSAVEWHEKKEDFNLIFHLSFSSW